MHESDRAPKTLVSVPNELEAAMIVSALAGHEIDATTAGGYTAGFRAEAPGEVAVLVRQSDLTRARQVLKDLTAQSASDSDLQDSVERSSGVGAVADFRGGTFLLAEILILALVLCFLVSRLNFWVFSP